MFGDFFYMRDIYIYVELAKNTMFLKDFLFFPSDGTLTNFKEEFHKHA